MVHPPESESLSRALCSKGVGRVAGWLGSGFMFLELSRLGRGARESIESLTLCLRSHVAAGIRRYSANAEDGGRKKVGLTLTWSRAVAGYGQRRS